MKIKVLLCILVLLFISGCAGPYTVAVVVRHAEKETSGSDPNLTRLGQERAQDLATALENLAITAVYSTNTNRTRQTATPMAESLSVPVQIYTSPSSIAATVLAEHSGEAVLIVGHSDTVGTIVTEFGASLPDGLPNPINEDDYDNMVTVIVNGDGVASAGHKTYGAESPPP